MQSSIGFYISLLLAVFMLTIPARTFSQGSTQNNRFLGIGIAGGALYGGSLIVLNNFWYKNYPRSGFHFFNDNDEWMQMDKFGHFFTSYYEGFYGMNMLRWAGLSKNKSIWFGGTWGLLMQTPIEVLDGFSSEWGFSWGDELANTLGTALLIGQEFAYGKQLIRPKFSYSPTEYAAMNPSVFGSKFTENLIKDYNGQTYWFSTPVSTFYQSNWVPTWFSVSFGLGADGMTRGRAVDQFNDPNRPKYQRNRQFYLSFDVNLSGIDTKNEVANDVLSGISWIKFPSPTVEYSRYRGFKAYLLYF